MLEAHSETFYMFIGFRSEAVCFVYMSQFAKIWK